MELRERIRQYIAKGTKTAQILGLFLKKQYVTASDIINFGCENTPLVFTTSPHKMIETLRKDFGFDFIKDEDASYIRTLYRNGKPYAMTEHYKRYFLNFEFEGV